MRRLRSASVLPALALASLIPLSAARAQMISSREGIALENQILELRQQIQALQQNNSGGSVLAPSQPRSPGNEGATNPLLPNMLQQVQTLEDQVQSLRGRVDTLEHEVATQHDEIKQEIGNLKFQLNQGGQGSGGVTEQNGAPPASPPAGGTLGTLPKSSRTTPPHPVRTVASVTAARRALAAHDYRTAEADSRAVIAHQGKGADGGAAEFTLAEALAHQGNHQAAAIAYDDAYTADKTGPHAPYALLGLANSLAAIHQDQAACDTLDSLTHQIASPPAGLAAQVRAARSRAHCG
ncbi:tetratricopeptide repeat protein [Acidiphilium iwatense]|uniref:YbgF trimerisation domain-containing protein n=1 Tax=Acidiphilium iwatense TaxID=768198 RepID=A0ABS9DSK1_9PROT|nr:hypothetical protein [Acidiphilium iwatense]MCF3945713.1 hypothetical protein [Acidiphilium iwatense]